MTEPFSVLVCGGRRFSDWGLLERTLDRLHAERPITKIIHGAAFGADSLAGWWACLHHVPVAPFRANWQEYGRAAGAVRNRQMLDVGRPDRVVAFPGGPGTKNMIAQAQQAGVSVLVVVGDGAD